MSKAIQNIFVMLAGGTPRRDKVSTKRKIPIGSWKAIAGAYVELSRNGSGDDLDYRAREVLLEQMEETTPDDKAESIGGNFGKWSQETRPYEPPIIVRRGRGVPEIAHDDEDR